MPSIASKHPVWITLTLLACALVALVDLVGCGSGSPMESTRGAATGKVSLAGTPLRGGSITLVAKGNSDLRVTTMIRSDGTFSVSNAPLGPVQIGVETESLKMGAPPEDYIAIPRRYANPETSELTATVEPSGEPLVIELTE